VYGVRKVGKRKEKKTDFENLDSFWDYLNRVCGGRFAMLGTLGL